jgi:hypothetical protein
LTHAHDAIVFLKQIEFHETDEELETAETAPSGKNEETSDCSQD